MTSALVFVVAEGLDRAAKSSRQEREYFTNYTTVAKQRKATNLFITAMTAYIATHGKSNGNASSVPNM